jgi:hypothetical protein
MFRELVVAVLVDGATVVFEFGVPISILSVIVTNSRDEAVWEILGEELTAVHHDSIEHVATYRIDEAPPEVLEWLRMAQQRADTRLESQGPSKPLRQTLRYGETPEGYRTEREAHALAPGKYQFLVTAEQGQGSVEFEVQPA